MYRIAISLFVLLLLATPANADYLDESQLRKVSAVFVSVNDGVINGCLPEPNSLKVEAELILRRSGIKVVEADEGHPHNLVITGAGGGIQTRLCAVTLEVALSRFEDLKDGSAGLVISSYARRLPFDRKPGFQMKLREVVIEQASRIANAILKARQTKPANVTKPSLEKNSEKFCGTTSSGVRWCYEQ